MGSSWVQRGRRTWQRLLYVLEGHAATPGRSEPLAGVPTTQMMWYEREMGAGGSSGRLWGDCEA